jgi:acyl carrier protein
VSEQKTRQIVLDVLGRIAPEMEPADIEADAPFRDQLDLDSMDFLNFVIALHERLGLEIPEADYPKLSTLNDAVAYLESRRGEAAAG